MENNKGAERLESWGEWIAYARERLGLSKTDLANRLGKSGLQYVHELEKGHIPKRSSIPPLAEALEQPLVDALLAAGFLPLEWCKGATRNMKETKAFLKKMQKV